MTHYLTQSDLLFLAKWVFVKEYFVVRIIKLFEPHF